MNGNFSISCESCVLEDSPWEKEARKNWLGQHSQTAWLPVIRCGKGCQDNITAINAHHICNGLEYVEIKMGVSGNWAVQASLEERCPLFLQDPLWPSHVILTNLGHSWENHLQRWNTWGTWNALPFWGDLSRNSLSLKIETEQQGA